MLGVAATFLVAAPGHAQTAQETQDPADAQETGNSGETSKSIPLKPVDVTGAPGSWGPEDGYVAPGSSVGTKMDTPLIETRQSATVITREQMDDRGDDGLTESLEYAPGVYISDQASQAVIDSYNVNIRGFSGQNAVFRDGPQVQAGMPYDTPVELFGVERVEVLRGPSSVLYGKGQPGGVINLVTKRPTDEPLYRVGAEYGSYDHKQATTDISDSLTGDGTLRYRLTALWQESDSHIDYVNNDRIYVASALTWAPTADTSLTLLTSYQKNGTRYPWRAFPRAATKGSTTHGSVPDNRYIGEPDFDGYDSEEYSVGYILEHSFGERWTFRQNARYRNVEYDIKDTFRNYYAAYISGPNDRTIERAQRIRYDEAETTTVDNRLISDWRLGVTEHTLLAGVDYKTLTYDTRDTGYNNPISELDLYDPEYASFTRPDFTFASETTKADQTGLSLQDHIEWTKRWVTTLGARQDWVSEKTTGSERDDQSALSLRAGAIYLADGGWAPYASYSESFTPQYGSDSVTGEDYEPITAHQYEIGTRWQPTAYNLSATAAVFEITRQNELVTDPNNSTRSIQVGETRSRGVELGLTADLTTSFQAIASYTYQDVEVVEAGAASTEEGKQLPDTPEQLAKLWLDYTFRAGPLEGLGFGGGVRYNGKFYGDAENTFENPAVTKVDASVRYRWRGAEPQLSANNLLDEQKVYCNGTTPTATCSYGMPRYIKGSVTYDF
ncbi:TonB-dependent siderophore receptor [Thiohalorhabdus sp. Cl-TMA]|uniref:TonB-dependent siderophore receptor n=1 Tax=Thiohalorhabdus methylotrophus TaxID=3242694 RepID=A0ABV4TXT7_9GAMM